ncbi:TAXI family TRAP transporter solute-binding subunit [Methylosinus sp. LW4]|uniref:TAXI family TRAP transporter solute-binding subunit n=1 Tax=Methylosinus sp. LW4 TaxID=136993 RepID=UPI00039AD107|nr:TAXI family TRAP transporter solute-binding subunit [Methylosinus sp. LW4]
MLRRRIAFSHLMHVSGLFGLTAAFAIVAIAISAFRLSEGSKRLRVAVGPAGGVDASFVEALSDALQHDRSAPRLSVVTTDGSAASAAALESRRVDLAVIRSDGTVPTNGAPIAVLHNDVAILVALSGSKGLEVGRLAGKRVGIVPASAANDALLDAILSEYGVALASVEHVSMSEADMPTAVAQRRVDALFAVAPLRGGFFERFAAALSSHSQGSVVLPFDSAEGIAARNPALRKVDVPAGLISGAPPRPKDGSATIAVSTRLEASRALSDEVVTRLTKRLFAVRRSIEARAPIAAAMEKADSDKDSPAAAHPGAAAYYDNTEKSFMDVYGDWIYVGAMAFSGVASGAAALLGVARARARKAALALIDDLIDLKTEAHATMELPRLGELEKTSEDLSTKGLRFARDHNFDSAGLAALRLAIDEARRAIDDQRQELEQQPQRLARATMAGSNSFEAIGGGQE